MQGWTVIDLGDAMLAGGSLAILETQLRALVESAGEPEGMAAYSRHETHGGLHCHLRIYLTPELSAVARGMGGIPCGRPESPGLGLLVGREEDAAN